MSRRAATPTLPIRLSAVFLAGLLVLPATPASASAAGPPAIEQLDEILLVGEFVVEGGAESDHLVVMWDEILDPRFVPDGTDFTVTVNAVDHHPTAVTFLFSGVAKEDFGFGADGVTFMQLDLPAGVTFGLEDTVTLDYEPGETPVRDLALAPATGFTDVDVLAADIGAFYPVVSVLDSYHGAERVVIVLSDPIEPGSLPAPSQFAVTVGAAPVAVTAVTDLYPQLGLGFIELTLATAVTDPATTVSVAYTSAPGTLVSRHRGDTLGDQAIDAVVIIADDAAAAELTAGDSLTTATGSGPTPGDPLATTVTAAADGPASITEGTVDATPPAGYAFFGHQAEIVVPDAPSPSQPNVLGFSLDASAVPPGEDETTIQVFRNGVLVPDCSGEPGVADPTPCVAERLALGDGDIGLTVLTVQASTWNLGVAVPQQFGGFLAPVEGAVPNVARAGRAIPIRFSLDGDRGLDIFATGSPSSRPVICDGLADGDPIEETVTAGASTLSYDAVTDTYTYVWKTAADWTDTCRRLTLTFAGGATATAVFDFRR